MHALIIEDECGFASVIEFVLRDCGFDSFDIASSSDSAIAAASRRRPDLITADMMLDAGTGLDAVEWAARAAELGAGEILLNSMDADGTKGGFDLEMLAQVRARVTVPLIASGGAGAVEHFPPAVAAGADAVLAASVFHFQQLTIGQVKDALRAAGSAVR